MIEPLPLDIVDRIRQDFGNQAEVALALLLDCRKAAGPDFIGDRLVRCIVFAARGDESRLLELIELERRDFRDVIMTAEYDVLGNQLRDLNLPFGSADNA